MKTFIYFTCLLVFTSLALSAGAQIEKGQGSFVYDQYEPLKDKPIRVWYYSPVKDPSRLQIVFVMHGMTRNADVYRDNWIESADQYGYLIVAPEFSKEQFPESRCYNLGNMFDKEGNAIEEAKWSYSLIEPLFNHVKELINGEQQHYSIFGHSAGAQFVHRFAMFKAGNRAQTIISSNAGWYTMPDFTVDYPYGLRGTNVSENELHKALQKKMIIQLGEADNDPNHKSLRRTKEAQEQGEHRFARGQHFYQTAVEASNELDADLNWEIRTVPLAGHFNKLMAIPAATYLSQKYFVHK